MKRKVGRPRKNPLPAAVAREPMPPAPKVVHYHVDISDQDAHHVEADELHLNNDHLIMSREGRTVAMFKQWQYVVEFPKDFLREDLSGEKPKIETEAPPAITQ